MGVADLVTTLYPRLYSVSDMKDDEGISNLRGEVKLPPMVRTSYDRLNPTGAYLLGKKKTLYGYTYSIWRLRILFSRHWIGSILLVG